MTTDTVPGQGIANITRISTAIYGIAGELLIDASLHPTGHGACLSLVLYDSFSRVIEKQMDVPFTPDEARELAAQLTYAANLHQEPTQ